MAQQLTVLALIPIAFFILDIKTYVSAAPGLMRDYPSFPEGQQHPLRLAIKANPEDSLREEVQKIESELFVKNNGPNVDDYVAMCVIVKDQNKDIREWMEYHLGIGISHFIVYDDESSVPVSTVLTDFVEAGQATVFSVQPSDWQSGWKSPQPYAFTSCHRDFRDRYDWLGFIDVDEFIVLADDSDTLPAFLRQYEAFASVSINQRVIGSSGHITRPEGGVIRNFVKCVPLSDGTDNIATMETGSSRWFKSIINTHHAGLPYFANPHHPEMCYNSANVNLPPCVDSDMRALQGLYTQVPVALDKVALYHYITKSFEEFQEKRARGSAMRNTKRVQQQRSDNALKFIDSYCTIECTVLAERARRKDHAENRQQLLDQTTEIPASVEASSSQDGE